MSKKQQQKFNVYNNFEITEEIFENITRIEEKRALAKNTMQKFEYFALGLDVDLSSFVVFEEPPTIHIASFVSFANTLAKMGYFCVDFWDTKSEKVCRCFLLSALIYLQYCILPCDRTFAKICSLSKEAEEDFEMFAAVMMSNVPNAYMKHYMTEMVENWNFDDFDYIFSNYIEAICIYYLEKNSSSEAMDLITNTICQDVKKYIQENCYDFFSLTEDEFKELFEDMEENDSTNNEKSFYDDEELQEGNCHIFE